MVRPPVYLTHFLKDYRISAVTKTSKFAVDKICKAIDFSRDITIVEYGPGEGVVTRKLLSHMTAASTLIAVETNDSLVRVLSATQDPRLIIVHDSVERITSIRKHLNIEKVNYVVSGIPFSFIPHEKRAVLVSQTRESLIPGGKFIVYQYSPRMVKYLKREFSEVAVSFIPLNFPSYFMMEALQTG